MKNIIYLLLLLVPLSTAGCKPEKSDPCIGSLCQNGSTCVDGHCVCINDFTGTKCEIAPDSCLHVSCGPHGTCVNGHCNCDINWTGANCDQQITPVDSFPGNYRMVGTRTYFVDSNGVIVDSVVAINDTITIVKFNDLTLQAYGYPLCDMQYIEHYGNAGNYNYLWLSYTNNNFSWFGFKKTFTDSAYYQSQTNHSFTSTSGKKIH